MELILYYIKESQKLLISFLILMLVIGILSYFAIINFRQDKKFKIFFYGLFLRMTSIDIFKLSIVILKSFLVVYSTIVLNDTLMWLCLIMIGILTILYVIFEHRKIVYEIICSLLQLVIIYFIYTVNSYMMEIENTSLILAIRTCLIVFVLILTTYLLFRDIDLISEDRMNKNFKNTKKAEKLTKGMN